MKFCKEGREEKEEEEERNMKKQSGELFGVYPTQS